jgi:hypothetical protein
MDRVQNEIRRQNNTQLRKYSNTFQVCLGNVPGRQTIAWNTSNLRIDILSVPQIHAIVFPLHFFQPEALRHRDIFPGDIITTIGIYYEGNYRIITAVKRLVIMNTSVISRRIVSFDIKLWWKQVGAGHQKR